jgi:hypothetical protein
MLRRRRIRYLNVGGAHDRTDDIDDHDDSSSSGTGGGSDVRGIEPVRSRAGIRRPG